MPPEPSVASSSSTELEHVLALLLNAPPSSLPQLVAGTRARISATEENHSYSKLLLFARETLDEWSTQERAAFVHGHPRIGAVAGLEGLSKQEQSDRGASPEVLERVLYLCYIFTFKSWGILSN
jgi:hypothetical protein